VVKKLCSQGTNDGAFENIASPVFVLNVFSLSQSASGNPFPHQYCAHVLMFHNKGKRKKKGVRTRLCELLCGLL
jgi:hypothetical protein